MENNGTNADSAFGRSNVSSLLDANFTPGSVFHLQAKGHTSVMFVGKGSP